MPVLRPLLAALAFALAAPLAFAAEAKQPNILFVFADDQSFETIAALGNDEIETPNLDRLVRRGSVFTRAYNQGSWSGAVCVASRTMLNTGRYLWHANAVYGSSEQERVAGRFWSEHLRAAGYETYMTGKWHVRADATKAFDHTVHIRPGMPKQTPQGYNRPLAGKKDVWSPWDKKFGGFWEGGTHWSELVADDAIGFLDHAEKSDKPFFMYLAFNAPHDPRQSPQEFVDKYPVDQVKLPVNFLTEYPFKDAIGCGKNLRDEKLAPFPRTEHSVKVARQEYYAIITHMDREIGRILDRLAKSDQADNTYIFFTADHGLGCGHHGLLGKQNLFEHSTRVPLFVVGPDVPQGKRLDAPVYMQDIMPTTLELAGVEKPEHVEFHSLLPQLRGETDQSKYDAVYGAYLQLQRSVTVGDYKLILYPKIAQRLLFNIKDDPQEMHNLAASAEHEATVRRLFKKLLDLQKETGDELDLVSVYQK
jgi:choline-sulfatase